MSNRSTTVRLAIAAALASAAVPASAGSVVVVAAARPVSVVAPPTGLTYDTYTPVMDSRLYEYPPMYWAYGHPLYGVRPVRVTVRRASADCHLHHRSRTHLRDGSVIIRKVSHCR